MICTEEYLDEVLARDEIILDAYDPETLASIGFAAKTVKDPESGCEITDLMIRCPCDDGYRWRFFISVANEDENGHLYGFRDRLMSRPGFEWREFNDLRRMSKFNAGTDVDEWMIAVLREMIERDAITIREAEA